MGMRLGLEGLDRILRRIRRPAAEAPVPYAANTGLSLPLLLGTDTADRERILEHSLTQSGMLFAVLDGIVGSVRPVRWHLYRRSPTGDPADRVEVPQHPALAVQSRPNPHMSWGDVVAQWVLHYELVGEAAAVLYRVGRVPVEIWPVRPDRLYPIPDRKKFLKKWEYRGPDGSVTPQNVEDVLWMRRPHPFDPYHGIGVVQSIAVDLQSARYTAEWNRNFFLNSATPGGIIEYPSILSDHEWAAQQKRWRASHQGVQNAHRVATIEGGGKWVNASSSMRDMQFTELRRYTSEAIREAFRFPVPLLGTTENVNRAVAQAALGILHEQISLPLLEIIREVLNKSFLSQYTGGDGLEFDFESPVKADEEIEIKWLEARATAAEKLVRAGYEPSGVLTVVGMPDIPWDGTAFSQPTGAGAGALSMVLPLLEAPARDGGGPSAGSITDNTPSRSTTQPPTGGEDTTRAATEGPHHHHASPHYHAQADLPDPPEGTPAELSEDPDLDAVQAAWLARLQAVLDDWGPVLDAQYRALADQVRDAVDSGDLTSLTNLSTPTGQALQALVDAMTQMAEKSADQAADEVTDQDVDAEPAPVDDQWIIDHAHVVTALLGTALAISAARVALRLAQSGMEGREVATAVREHLDSLTDAQPRLALGAALTAAQNESRIATFAAAAAAPDAPIPAYYASEVLDVNTCAACREVDRKWLGNDLTTVRRLYPGGGYLDCEGGPRCRGTVVVVWRPGADTTKWTEKEPL